MGCSEDQSSSFGPLRLLQERGNFQVFVEAADPRRVLIIARPDANALVAQKRLAAIAAAHAKIREPRVPAVSELGEREGRPFLAFACSAVTDLSRVIERAHSNVRRIDYAEGIVFIEMMMEVLRATHDAGTVFGALTLKNVLVDQEGRCHVIGAGDNVLALDEHAAPLNLPDVCFAPDVAAGSATSPGADLYALTLLVRRLIPYVQLPARAERVLTGRVEPEDYELFQLFAWCNLAILATHPDKRPGVAEALENERRAWHLLGVEPNRDGYRDLLLNQEVQEARPELLTDDAASYVAVAGTEPKPLGTRRALRRILSALVQRHGSKPEEPLSVHELAEAGWPGELLLAEAAKNRVYVALSSLRKLGLELLLERHDGGWRIAPTATVRIQ